MVKQIQVATEDWVVEQKNRTQMTWNQILMLGLEEALKREGKTLERPEAEPENA